MDFSAGKLFSNLREGQNVMEHQPKPCLLASELFPSTKESILKKLLHVERSTVKLLKAVLHQFCSDKDQDTRLYDELLSVVDDLLALTSIKGGTDKPIVLSTYML